MVSPSHVIRSVCCLAPLALAPLDAFAQDPARESERPQAQFVLEQLTPIADPKLDGSTVDLAFRLEGTTNTVPVTAEIWTESQLVATVWSGDVIGGGANVQASWNGRASDDSWCSIGTYILRISGGATEPLEAKVKLIRLGVTEIEAQASLAGADEWQMVYFRKGGAYSYYATPAIHEYYNVAAQGDASDLDLNDGSPRPAVSVHAATDEPVMDGAQYNAHCYNYPLAYRMGAEPRLELRMGATSTSTNGQTLGVAYPVSGYELRAVVELDEVLVGTSAALAPGDTFEVILPALPNEIVRVDRTLDLRYQYRATGAQEWTDLPGQDALTLRFYTTLGQPLWGGAANGTQYSGPWVEVAEYYHAWKTVLGLSANDPGSLTELHVHGFVGQNGGLPEAIEGVLYDAYPLGGDGGASHYFNWGTWRMDLSRLLDGHANGEYVNCTDNAGATTTMLSMMGAPNVQPLRLGNMTLRAIWGIGAPDYTTDLWGSGNHGFTYHHIVTDDGGVTVSDTCMQLDEDGSPNSTPGIPGWNVYRSWTGPLGYNQLSSYNFVSKTLDDLPGVY